VILWVSYISLSLSLSLSLLILHAYSSNCLYCHLGVFWTQHSPAKCEKYKSNQLLSGGFDICKQVFHIKGKSYVEEAQVQIWSIGTCREKESLDCSIWSNATQPYWWIHKHKEESCKWKTIMTEERIDLQKCQNTRWDFQKMEGAWGGFGSRKLVCFLRTVINLPLPWSCQRHQDHCGQWILRLMSVLEGSLRTETCVGYLSASGQDSPLTCRSKVEHSARRQVHLHETVAILTKLQTLAWL